MPYTRAWDVAVPGNVPAHTLDDQIRNLKVDLGERLNDIIGSTAWSTAADPLINGTTARSLTALATAVDAKPTINPNNNYIPVRTGAGAFGNSLISSSGTTVNIEATTTIINGSVALQLNSVSYVFPGSQGAAASILRNDGSGGLSWVTIASLGGGDITGSGTSGKLAKFDAAKNIVDSILTESGAAITVAGSISATALSVTGAGNIETTGALLGGSLLVAGAGGDYPGVTSVVSQGWIGSSFGYYVSTNRVVGARITGWGAPTGTATRTTFVTSTVTLELLAQRVKALIDDLTTHGLIGA